jgi:hypothetical protein
MPHRAGILRTGLLGIWFQASCLCIAVLPSLGIKLGFALPSHLVRCMSACCWYPGRSAREHNWPTAVGVVVLPCDMEGHSPCLCNHAVNSAAGGTGADQWHLSIALGILCLQPGLQPDAAGELQCSAGHVVWLEGQARCEYQVHNIETQFAVGLGAGERAE